MRFFQGICFFDLECDFFQMCFFLSQTRNVVDSYRSLHEATQNAKEVSEDEGVARPIESKSFTSVVSKIPDSVNQMSAFISLAHLSNVGTIENMRNTLSEIKQLRQVRVLLMQKKIDGFDSGIKSEFISALDVANRTGQEFETAVGTMNSLDLQLEQILQSLDAATLSDAECNSSQQKMLQEAIHLQKLVEEAALRAKERKHAANKTSFEACKLAIKGLRTSLDELKLHKEWKSGPIEVIAALLILVGHSKLNLLGKDGEFSWLKMKSLIGPQLFQKVLRYNPHTTDYSLIEFLDGLLQKVDRNKIVFDLTVALYDFVAAALTIFKTEPDSFQVNSRSLNIKSKATVPAVSIRDNQIAPALDIGPSPPPPLPPLASPPSLPPLASPPAPLPLFASPPPLLVREQNPSAEQSPLVEQLLSPSPKIRLSALTQVPQSSLVGHPFDNECFILRSMIIANIRVKFNLFYNLLVLFC
jgi:hypothetical protein